MNTDDLDAMKFDRRMRFRRGWVSDSEVSGYLEALPDVSAKAGDPEAPKAPEPSTPTPFSSPEPAPVAAAVPTPEPKPVETSGVAAFGALPDDPTHGG